MLAIIEIVESVASPVIELIDEPYRDRTNYFDGKCRNKIAFSVGVSNQASNEIGHEVDHYQV